MFVGERHREREEWVGDLGLGEANGKRDERGGTYGVAKGWGVRGINSRARTKGLILLLRI